MASNQEDLGVPADKIADAYIDEPPADSAAQQVPRMEESAEKETAVDQPEPEVATDGVDPDYKQDVEFRPGVFSAKTNDRAGESVALPSDHDAATEAVIRGAPNMDYSGDQIRRKWGMTLNAGIDNYPYDAVGYKTLGREGTAFRQGVPTAQGILTGSHPSFKKAPSDMTGETAVMRFKAHRKLGSMFRIPLWNSGIWLTVKAPSEPALLELYRAITTDKIELGRRSYGLSFSNLTAIFVDRLTAFAIEHVYAVNVKLAPGQDIRSLIRSNDSYAIAQGMAAAIWPNGFEYSRACTADPSVCTHTITEIIDVAKTLLVDTAGLTQWQIAHMSKSGVNVVTSDDVKRYQDELLASQDRRIVIDEGEEGETAVVLRVPSLLEFIESGYRWISEISTLVERGLSKETQNDQRNTFLIENAQATSLRQYSHWISAVAFGGLPDVSDSESIESLLNVMSSDDKAREQLMKKIEDYIAASTITVIAIPSYECPVCGGVNSSDKKHPTIRSAIPIDVFQVFFALLAQKVQRISER